MVPLYNLSIEHVNFNLCKCNFDRFCLIDFSILSVNYSHVCIIYGKIYEKKSSGGLEASLSIVNQIIFHARLMNSNKNCDIKNQVIVLDY